MANRNSKVYRKICFKYHKKQCVCCGEHRIVTVHHLDDNYENNSPVNLIPLCPTCHAYMHSTHRPLKFGRVMIYVTNFRAKHKHRLEAWYNQYYTEAEDEEKT